MQNGTWIYSPMPGAEMMAVSAFPESDGARCGVDEAMRLLLEKRRAGAKGGLIRRL